MDLIECICIFICYFYSSNTSGLVNDLFMAYFINNSSNINNQIFLAL